MLHCLRNSTRGKSRLRKNSIKTLLVSVGLLTLPATATIAQGTTARNTNTALPPPAEASEDIREKVLRYLESDIFITEGYGLKKVHLGQSMDDLIEQIGQPHKSNRVTLFGGNRKLYYRIDSNTEMLVIVTKRGVEQIVFEGNLSSSYSTYSGARFGMSQAELQIIYGNGAVKKSTIRYSRKGIGFGFKNGKINIIQVFPKGS